MSKLNKRKQNDEIENSENNLILIPKNPNFDTYDKSRQNTNLTDTAYQNAMLQNQGSSYRTIQIKSDD